MHERAVGTQVGEPTGNSAVVNPASPCFRIAMICSSPCRVPFMVVLLLGLGRTHILRGPGFGGSVNVIYRQCCPARHHTRRSVRGGLKTPVQTADTNIISILLFSQPPQTQRPWLKRVLYGRRSQSAEAGAPASEDAARPACKRYGPSFDKEPPLHAPLPPLQ